VSDKYIRVAINKKKTTDHDHASIIKCWPK